MGVVADLCSALAKLSGLASENVRLFLFLAFQHPLHLFMILKEIVLSIIENWPAVPNPYSFLEIKHVHFRVFFLLELERTRYLYSYI